LMLSITVHFRIFSTLSYFEAYRRCS
jgi:hypothetical protein